MKAIVLARPGFATVNDVTEPRAAGGEVLLQVRIVGLCGSDLNSYRGRNPLVSYPRVPGHEIAATVVDPGPSTNWQAGTNVTLLPYFGCGRCAACQRGRPNACLDNQTLGVQCDGALTEFVYRSRNCAWSSRLRLVFMLWGEDACPRKTLLPCLDAEAWDWEQSRARRFEGPGSSVSTLMTPSLRLRVKPGRHMVSTQRRAMCMSGFKS